MNSVKSIVNGNSGGSTPFVPTSTATLNPNTATSTAGPTSASLTTHNSDEKCYKGNGYYPDLASGCQQYYVCLFFGK